MILRFKQWTIWWLGMWLGGLSFPFMKGQPDEAFYFENNWRLNDRDADGKLADGIEEAYWRVGEPGKFWHDVKNVPHEWYKKYPKLAFKFSAFVIVMLTVFLIASIGLNAWLAL